jgi:glycolate oxidase
MSAIPLTDFPTDRLTRDLIERTLYSRDLAPVPSIMTRPFFRTLPDAVVRPGSAEQVAEVLRYATREHIPVTPRAAASTAYYNSVPVRGGFVLDVNSLRGIVELDAARHSVRVLPATTWFELDDALRLDGAAVKSYPSSAVAATIGGWVSTQGHGMGSLKYGSLGDQLISLQVVLPGGEIRTITRESDPPLAWFVAAEGTLGVITQIELSIRPRPASESQHLFAFADLKLLGSDAAALAQSAPRPFTIFFADAGYLELLRRAGFTAPDEKGVLLTSFQGDRDEVRQGTAAPTQLRGRELPSDLALEEWNLRLYHMRTKRAGPSQLAAEQWLPLKNLSGYLQAVKQLADRHRLLLGTYGVVVSPEQAMIITIYPADERHTASYLCALGFTKRLHDLGARYGGRPYGVGLWNTPYLSRLFDRAQLAELKQRKARLDPAGIMNPGKLYQASFPLWPITFAPAAEALALAHTTLGGKPSHEKRGIDPSHQKTGIVP